MNQKPTEIDDPWKIIKQFKEGAVQAKKAGFDGVEGASNGTRTFFLHADIII